MIQHIYSLFNLSAHHRNPFNCLLIAQSQVEKMTLATVDSAFVGVPSAKADAVRTALPNRHEIDRTYLP